MAKGITSTKKKAPARPTDIDLRAKRRPALTVTLGEGKTYPLIGTSVREVVGFRDFGTKVREEFASGASKELPAVRMLKYLCPTMPDEDALALDPFQIEALVEHWSGDAEDEVEALVEGAEVAKGPTSPG